MNSSQIRKKYIEFFVARGHKEIPSASLVPENDPTTLFTSSGMQPLVPYLLGQSHPLGKRLVNSQKSFRALDIDEVGDNRHTTFFEMLGNWSLGDYFKDEQLEFIWQFLTDQKEGLGLPKDKLFVSIFQGNKDVPRDEISFKKWLELGVPKNHIFEYDASKNWWSRSGEPENMPPGEPGGPDSEVFFDFGEQLQLHQHSQWKNEKCHPNCDCGRYLEIANSVFMQYVKKIQNSRLQTSGASATGGQAKFKIQNGTENLFEELPQRNVDFGGGLERMTAATINNPDIFQTDLFMPLITTIEGLSKRKYRQDPDISRAMQIIADHIKGAVMMMADGVLPANKTQGYVLRRLIRRSLLHGRKLGLVGDWKYVGQLVEPVAGIYQEAYPEVVAKAGEIKLILEEEALRFGKSLEKGLREIEKINQLDGVTAFKLYETFGFPWEMTEEVARERGQVVKKGEFAKEFKKHQDQSRTAAKGMFKGGLSDHSEEVVKLHTATHLLHQALRTVLGNHVQQKGSNITAERLRFDFSHTQKLTPEEINKVEELVNEQIQKDLPVTFKITTYAEVLRNGALAFFGERYPEKVKVYSIGPRSAQGGSPFSREICGGPHVEHTGVIGKFKITKEEALGAGTRRIYAVVE